MRGGVVEVGAVGRAAFQGHRRGADGHDGGHGGRGRHAGAAGGVAADLHAGGRSVGGDRDGVFAGAAHHPVFVSVAALRAQRGRRHLGHEDHDRRSGEVRSLRAGRDRGVPGRDAHAQRPGDAGDDPAQPRRVYLGAAGGGRAVRFCRGGDDEARLRGGMVPHRAGRRGVFRGARLRARPALRFAGACVSAGFHARAAGHLHRLDAGGGDEHVQRDAGGGVGAADQQFLPLPATGVSGASLHRGRAVGDDPGRGGGAGFRVLVSRRGARAGGDPGGDADHGRGVLARVFLAPHERGRRVGGHAGRLRGLGRD